MDLNRFVSQIDVGSGEAAYLIVMDNVLEVPTRNQVYLVNGRQRYVQAVVIVLRSQNAAILVGISQFDYLVVSCEPFSA